ncbi:putative 2-carboxy-D-arabinitol-1-phosphatase [Drosera capensis]
MLVVAHNAVNQALIASSIGPGAEYFRRILQSNCGVSALDFIPRATDGSPHVCLNRLNQTPNSPIVAGSSGGRNTSQQIILVCRGLNNVAEICLDIRLVILIQSFPSALDGQSQKAAELLLDVRVDTVVTSPRKAMTETADIISKTRIGVTTLYPTLLEGFGDEVLGALWDRSKKAWHSLLEELQSVSRPERNVVVVCHPVVHIALIAYCLNLNKEWMSSFHLDDGSIRVLDFPDGPSGKGVVWCTNYTAHLGRWSIPITKPTSDSLEV